MANRGRLCAAAAAFLAAASCAAAATGIPPDKTAALQALIDSKVSDAGIPGALLAVETSDGSWIGAAGKADLSTGEALSAGMQVRLASITKTFTATLIMRLVELRKLSLDDTVERWLPGKVVGGDRMPIRMLLDHTSGIYDHEAALSFFIQHLTDPAREWTAAELLAFSNAHGVEFPPGARFSYTNSGYYVLGMIAEAATGERVADLASRLLFGPAGMTRTALTVDGALSAPYARGYSWLPTTGAVADTTDWNFSWDWTAGSGVSTARDMLAWVRALFGGTIVGRSSLDQMEAVTAPSTSYGFAMAWEPLATYGERAIGHGGENSGTETRWLYFPDSGRAIFCALTREDTGVGPVDSKAAMTAVLSGAWAILNPLSAADLSGNAVSSDTIRWSWTVSGGPASGFDLFTSSGGLVKSLSGSASYYLETGLSSATLHSRYLQASNSASRAFSSTMTLATPDSCISGTSSDTLVGADGRTQLTVPQALLSADRTWILSESPLQRPLMDNTLALIAAAGTPADLRGSTGSWAEFILAVDGIRSTTLALPVAVAVPYSDSVHPGFVDGTSPPVPVGTLQLYTINEATRQWEVVPGSAVDLAHKLVTGRSNHLSIFAALGIASSAYADLSQARVYPVPYRPNGSDRNRGRPYSAGDPISGIIFDHLTQTVTIDIYAVTGRRVAHLESSASGGRLQWDASNDSGQDVASGGYVAILTSPGCASATRKLLIVR
ncbi:MAG: serine hydrolase [Elusimicrobia bacterium]|nr:serine hydrolase [Elusimicrobiota bacterium]